MGALARLGFWAGAGAAEYRRRQVESVAPYALSAADRELVGALRAGDETAFGSLIDRYFAPMLSVARAYVATREAAEDVVQETWMGVIEGIDRFEGRCSLKTWMYRILVNRARTRGERESRTRPFSSLERDNEPVVDPARFVPAGHRWGGMWATPPSRNFPEEQTLAGETRGILQSVLEELPANQRTVLSLRDLQDLTSEEVCELLNISEGNQRVLLHRARAKARNALERYFDEPVEVTP
jgi:RNA polymerase sigma-70 factor (ECF subfamily)